MIEDQIAKRINAMGYVTCKPVQITPCYYRINDGTDTILRVLIVINHLTPRAGSARDFDVNSSVQVNAFVPVNRRTPGVFVPYSETDLGSSIDTPDVKYEVLREDFSVYSMSDGTTISVKAAMGQIDRTRFVTPQGEPVYVANPVPVTKIRRGGM